MNSSEKKEDNRIAVALRYDKEDSAPTVIAKGRGVIAKRIIQRGIDENISICENTKAVNDLYKIDIGAHIPEELYSTVATILAFVYELDKDKGEDFE